MIPSGQLVVTDISFAIRLAAALPANKVHVAPEPTNCAGTVAEPKATSGHLCVYTALLQSASFISALEPEFKSIGLLDGGPTEGGASTSGARLLFGSEGAPNTGYGSWAVTG